jgi:hypothetical protein
LRYISVEVRMGVHYKIICDELRQYIDPGHVRGQGRKLKEILHGPAWRVVLLWATREEGWRGKSFRIVDDQSSDLGDVYYECTRAYEDVTSNAVRAWNEWSEQDEELEMQPGDRRTE